MWNGAMTANEVEKFTDAVVKVTMDWSTGLAVGDSLAEFEGEPHVTIGAVEPGSGRVVAATAVILDTTDAVTTIQIGPDASPGRARIALLAYTLAGERLAENIEVTIKPRW